VSDELAQALVEQGYLSYDDLSVIEPEALMEMGGLTEEQVNRIVEQAELRAEEAEEAAAEQRRQQREQAAAGEGAERSPSTRRGAAAHAATGGTQAPQAVEQESPEPPADEVETDEVAMGDAEGAEDASTVEESDAQADAQADVAGESEDSGSA
jgi:N utilization substance protein A